MESDNENIAQLDDESIVSELDENLTDDEAESDLDLDEEEDEDAISKAANTLHGDNIVDSEEEEDDNYLEKFDQSIRKSVVENYHPEALSVNQTEMINMAKVTRNERGIIIDDLHRTIPMMTKYEYTTILGQRAEQLNEGDVPLVKVPNGVMDGYLIAKMEMDQKRVPFIIKRPIPGGGFEYWHVEDLDIVHEPLYWETQIKHSINIFKLSFRRASFSSKYRET